MTCHEHINSRLQPWRYIQCIIHIHVHVQCVIIEVASLFSHWFESGLRPPKTNVKTFVIYCPIYRPLLLCRL